MSDRSIFDFESVKQTGNIPCFHLERDTIYLPHNRKTKKLKAVLLDIEENHNHSWYSEMYNRSQTISDMPALFYRGNMISFHEMISSADKLASALREIGIRQGNEIAVCMSNVPELAYVMLALNKLGAKMNSFSASYNPEYVKGIMSECDSSVIFTTDDVFESIGDQIIESRFRNIVLISKARSLPVDLNACGEYVSELDKYYRISDLTGKFIGSHNVISYDMFLEKGSLQEIPAEKATLDTEFLVSYTSGSTKIGFPKAIIHTNRSLIVSGRFHDAEISGNPDLKGLRALAAIHPDSNTCLITCISDILMQGWCVAFEPEYNISEALDYLILNKPNYANMTCSFWNEAARQYLIEKRFANVKLGFLLAAFAVGENLGRGEEYFLNRFLRKARAGSAISIKGFHMPYSSISIGGGDCEHGGIYYTLWRALYSRIHSVKLGRNPIGMLPEKYVVVSSLKKKNECWTECHRKEIGLIVANSATTMKCYKNNITETIRKIIRDDKGRDWVSCNVLGYIDETGAVHVKGRVEEFRKIGAEIIYPFNVDDIIDQDVRNILSSTTVFKSDGTIVANILISPLAVESVATILANAKERCKYSLSVEVNKRLKFIAFNTISEFPITGSGKRNIRALEEL